MVQGVRRRQVVHIRLSRTSLSFVEPRGAKGIAKPATWMAGKDNVRGQDGDPAGLIKIVRNDRGVQNNSIFYPNNGVDPSTALRPRSG